MKKRKTRFRLTAGFMGVGLAIAAMLFGKTVSASQPKPSQLTTSQIPGSFQIPQFGIPQIITTPTTPTRSPLDFFTDITVTHSLVNQSSITPTTQTVNIVTGAVQPSAFAPSPGAAIVQPVGLLFPSGVNAQSFQAWWSNLTGAISALQAGNATFSSSLTNLPISNRLPDGTPFPGGLNSSDLPILQSAFNAYLKTAQALGLT